jgi:16S rRNA (uracil1498-N3)-methyltransferase
VTLALFLVDELPAGDRVVLTGDEARHAQVKRLRIGEDVLVGDGRGTVVTAQVGSLARDAIELTVTARRTVAALSPRLIVVQALPKGERADLAVELLTELGVDEIVPWRSAHAVTQWDGERGAKARERWQRIAREAAKQSRRAWLPVVAEPASTAEVAERLTRTATALVLHEAAHVGLGSVPIASAGDLVLVVGPEGGISPDELAQFGAAGATAVRLGEAVLRTSTAGGAALAAISLRLGRWA